MTKSPLAPSGVKRIALFAEDSRAFISDAALIKAITDARHKVRCYAPVWDAEAAALVNTLYGETEIVALTPSGWALMRERKAVSDLAKSIADWKAGVVSVRGASLFNLVLPAARKAKVARTIALIDNMATESDIPGGGDDELADHALLRKACALAGTALFMNRDDANNALQRGIVQDPAKTAVSPGTGVDVAEHAVLPLPAIGQGLVFAMQTNADAASGAESFVRAALSLKPHAPATRFILVLEPSRSARSIDLETVKDLAGDVVEVRDANALQPLLTSEAKAPGDSPVNDPQNSPKDAGTGYLSECHVAVYAPRSASAPETLWTAMAAGRPIIASDAPGCRDTVDERVNGCLVKPGSDSALASAMQSFLRRPDLIPAMARASRSKAERMFDRKVVMPGLLSVYGLTD